MSKGYVYILGNQAHTKDLYKIGMTTRTPNVRAKELYFENTAVPVAFDVLYEKQIMNCQAAEELIHICLDQFRFNKDREFFQIPLDKAKNIVDMIAGKINKLYTEASEQVIAVDTTDPDYYYNQGLSYIKNGNAYVGYDYLRRASNLGHQKAKEKIDDWYRKQELVFKK